MRTHSRFFRLTATTAIVGLTFGTLLPEISFAQTLPPLAAPAAVQGPEAQTTADPPTRVGRLSRLVGQVSFHGIGADHWDTASLNFPVTSGDSFWTQPSASADLGVTSNRVTMDQSTELDVATLDDHSFVGTVPQGQIYLRLLALAPGETYTITTPRGVVAITTPGRYEITAGDTQNPTRITVVQGAAQVSGSNLNLQVAANQTVLITGTDPFQTQVVPAQRDQFLTGQLSRERPAVIAGGVTAPAVVEQMTGGEDLSQYGTWQQSPQYGTVWYPQVAPGYVPYRNGHWAFVQPWGWTWIDAAPWGFAPFHYGRWVEYGGRWGWAPGGGVDVAVGSPGYYAPVYAPALVTFLGIAAGVAVGAALAGGFGGNVGWCPLGWQEPYHPWYRSSPNYVRNVNVTSVRNVTNITNITNNNTTTINNFSNRAGATMVPASAMAMSRPINTVARPIPAAQFAAAQPVIGRDPIAPTTATAGVTPRVAQQLHLAAPPPGAGAAPRPQAPGPVIRTQAAAPNERPALETNGRPLAPGAAPVAGAATPNERPALETNSRPTAPGAAPGVPATAEHAPGPPIEPRGTAAAPNTTPALRTPAEVARPTAQAPGAPTEAHPGAAPQTQIREAPHETTQAVQPHETTQAVQPHETTQAAQPHETTQAVQPHVAAPAVQPHPQVAAPQVHEPAPAPRVVQEAHPAAPQVHAPTPAPHVVEQARPVAPVAAPRPAPAPAPRPQPQPQPQAHSAPPPRPQPHPAPQEHRQQSGQRGGGGHEPHRG